MAKRLLLLLVFFIPSIPAVCAMGIEYYPPSMYGFNPLFEEQEASIDVQSPLFEDTTIIDFERRQITFIKYDIFTGFPVWQVHYDELDKFLNSMFELSLHKLWFEGKKKRTEEEKKPAGVPSLELVMPVHYPAWARRVIGKDPPKLSIKGFQSITVSYKKRKLERSVDLNTAEQKPTGGFGFDYDNMFTIRGSVGRLIDIEIKTGKQKSDEDFSLKDQMKKLKIEYKADPDSADQLEDEIIQEVVAGYTNFQMPGQGLAGYSGSHEGLFGVKVRSQWGPLALTTIMSRENAETQKTKIDPSGKTGGEVKLNETEIARDVYFFLDTIFLQKFTGELDTAVEVTKLEVFKQEGMNQNFNKQDFVWGMYGNDSLHKSTEATLFRKLYEKIDYEYDKKAGWIRFIGNTSLGAENVITIYMERSDSVKKGDNSSIDLATGDKGYKLLWLLKNKEIANNPAELLMWRNVYTLPQDAKPEDFKIEIVRRTPDGKGEKKKNSDSLFSFILGITDKNGNPDVGNEGIFDFERKHLILPPWKQYVVSKNDTVYSNRPFENPALGAMASGESNLSSSMYTDTATTQIINYDIITTGSSKQTVFNIGWGIIPNSEKLVAKNGKELVKDVDYLIDYEFGSVTLISPLAKSQSEIDVDYQQESLFMFESKRFLGAYGKLDLPNIGRESYFATSIMGQFTSSKDKIPRVGAEPFNRMLFDANLRLDFEPEWMTGLINLIPLVKTTSTSSATMDLEVAYSYLRPDKENKGEAYLDNFQSSEKGYPLGESHTLWYKASPSIELIGKDGMLSRPPAWRSYWYSPITSERTKRDEIWELTDEDTRNRNEYLTTLRLVCQPLPNNDTLIDMVKDAVDSTIRVNPWAGIMTPIPNTLQDRRKDRFLEFYVKNKEKRGVLYIDIGELGEDISLDGGEPNKSANYENRYILQGERDSKSDLGLDSLPDSLEAYLFPNINKKKWDTLSFGNSLLGELKTDPARDNWNLYNIDNTGNKRFVNGTQNDKNITSEDINGDGVVKNFSEENYFRVKIDFSNPLASNCLDTAKTHAVNQPDSGWIYFRIPLNETRDSLKYYEIHGKPRWDNIKFVRLLWTGIKSEAVMKGESQLEFTEIKFTGNQWEDVPVKSTGEVKLAVSVINSVDDKGYYERPLYIDSLDKEKRLMKDYALRLEYENLKHGEEAIVKRDIPSFQKIDLSLYEKIEMYITDAYYSRSKGRMIFEPHIYIDSGGKLVDVKNEPWVKYHKENFARFVFRFGNSDSSYYEFSIISLSGYWVKDQGLSVDLQKFAAMKQAYHVQYGDRLDSINISDTLQDGSIYRIFSRTGNLPTFSNIQWMALGALRHNDAIGLASGVIWVNSLRLKGIKPLDGWAFRANLNTQWADFMDLSGNVSYDDADFRQMSNEPQLVKDAKLSAGFNAQWTLNKFLPELWGVNIPFGTGVAANLSRPKQRPGTDIFLTDDRNEADGIGDMVKDFADLLLGSRLSDTKTEAENYQKNQVTKTLYTSYSKTANSDNPIVNLTADRITTSYSYSKDSTTELEGILPEGDKNKLERANVGENHINVQASRNYSGILKYDLSPRQPPKWTSWSPFTDIKWKQFPQQMKSYEFKLLPSRINFDLMDGTFTKTYTYRSLRDVVEANKVELSKENLGMTHGLQFSYSPIAPLVETNFDIAVNRNFDDALQDWGRGTGRFIKEKVFALDPVWKHYLMTYAEKARNQNASIRMDPQFVDWLSHTGDYRVKYSQSPRTYKDDPNYISTKVDNEFGFSSNFRLRSLLTTLSERTEKIKGLSAVFKRIGTGLDKIDLTAFNFTYNTTSNLNNDYVSTGLLYDKNMGLYDFFKYQVGVKGRNLKDVITGNMDDDAAFGGMRYRYDYDEELYRNDRRTVNQNYTITTSLALPKPIDVSIRPISLSWTRGYSVLPNPMIMDSTKTFPELQLGANSNVLEKLPIVKKNLQNLGMQSTYRLSKSVKKSYSNPNDINSTIRRDITRKHAWDPLVSFDGMLKKWPVNLDYAIRLSLDSLVSFNGDSLVPNSGKKNKTLGNTWNIKYTLSGKPDRQMNFLNRWTVPIKGETVFSVDVTHTSNKSTQESLEETGIKEESDWALNLHPKITYDFTDNIDGLLEYIFEKSYNSFNEEKRTNNALLFTVTIHFN